MYIFFYFRSRVSPAFEVTPYYWSRDDELDLVIPDPIGHEWSLEERLFIPLMSEKPGVPEFLVKLINCTCIKKSTISLMEMSTK